MSAAVEGEELVFRLPDRGREHGAVSVWVDVELGVELAMRRVRGGWARRIPLPELDCLEYLLDVDGELTPDPGNPQSVDGAFGPHSWLALPGYHPPAWLDARPVAGIREPMSVAGVELEVWQPAGATGAELPLLLVHDGPEMDAYARVTQYAATRPRPVRVALLAPGPARDERYAADAEYADTLVDGVVPALRSAYPTVGAPLLMGASLGGLAALHAAWTRPGSFGGLLLQSGSFFTPRLDPQESGWAHFEAVTGFVARVLGADRADLPSRVTMTCGTAEENLANNRALRDQLRRLGVPVGWDEVRQGHTWTCWRDLLDPHLGDLLGR